MDMNEYMLDRYYRRKAIAIRVLGGECVKCGATKELEFDHIDPDTKISSIGKMLASASYEKLNSELKKCQLLCKKHHHEKTKSEYAELTECLRGHALAGKNLGVSARGTRFCKYCKYVSRAKSNGYTPKTFEKWL